MQRITVAFRLSSNGITATPSSTSPFPFRSLLTSSELRQSSILFQRSHFATEVRSASRSGSGSGREKGEKKVKGAEEYVNPDELMAFYQRTIQPLFPKLVDIPTTGHDDLTPFQRGLRVLKADSSSSSINNFIQEKWAPNQEINKSFEELEAKENKDLQRFEQILRDCARNNKKLSPTEFRNFASEVLRTEDSEVLNKLQTLYDAPDASKRTMKGKQERRKLIFSELSKQLSQFEEKKNGESFQNQIMVDEFQEFLRSAATLAPELVAVRTFIKGIASPLDQAEKKVNRYNAYKIRAAAKRREKEGEKPKKVKTPPDVEIGIKPNALRYVDQTHPFRQDLEAFAYAIGFNKSWTEEDKKKLVQEYAKLLKTPIPDTEEFKEIVYLNSDWRNRSDEVRRAQFEEMYNEEVQNLEGGEGADADEGDRE
jgi:uncharacterized protein YukE